MANDLEHAKQLLLAAGTTCVLCKGESVKVSDKRGVSPLVDWIRSGTDLRGYSAADKIVGKAAALLFVLAGVKEVYAPVMSEGAVKTFGRYGVGCHCDQVASMIINRVGTGPCPMEQAVEQIAEPEAALHAIQKTMARLGRGEAL